VIELKTKMLEIILLQPGEGVLQEEASDAISVLWSAAQVNRHSPAQRSAEDKDPAGVDVRTRPGKKCRIIDKLL